MVETMTRVDEQTKTLEEIKTLITDLTPDDATGIQNVGEQIQRTLRQHALSHPELDSRVEFNGIRPFATDNYQTGAVFDLRTGQLSFYGAPRAAESDYTRDFLVRNFDSMLTLI